MLWGAIDLKASPDEVLASGEYPLTRRDLAEIAAMIYADAGISLNESKASLVYSRLSKHIRALGLPGFRDYCLLVSSPAGSAARREMLSHLTTNFTRFFRENHHFDHLRTEVLPGLLARAKAGGRADLVGGLFRRARALFDRANGPVADAECGGVRFQDPGDGYRS